jgi:plastocyanin
MRAWFLIPALLASATAHAATLTVTVRSLDGKPVANAVVAVHLVERPTPMPTAGRDFAVQQKDLQFSPFVLVVPVNSDVSFPNLDKVRHHVYSFSPAKKFELKLYAREQERSVHFDKAGVVPLGCNIHDQMTGFIVVADTPWTVRTDAAGNAVLTGLPPGQLSLSLWHPWLRTPGNSMAKQIALGANGGSDAFAVVLRAPPRAVGASGY